MTHKKRYVLGFLFDEWLSKVVLIQKNRPNWQAGYLNGVGGKVENDDPWDSYTMAREFEEETGLKIYSWDWKQFDILSGDDYEVVCFTSISSEIDNVISKTDEIVQVIDINKLLEYKTIPNIQDLINSCFKFYNTQENAI